MISGYMADLENYLPDPIKEKITTYIRSLNSDSKEGYTYLDGNHVYGRVMSYNSKIREECAIEAHNKYVDIQVTLSGVEGIEVYDRRNLEIKTIYDEENDIIFLKENEEALFAAIKNYPGYFSMFFPEDAHRPMISADGSERNIKKYVIKIERSLFK